MPEKHSYLWPYWLDFLKQQKDIRIVTFGTLINRNSIQETISSLASTEPVIALRVKRIFNFALIDDNYVDQGGRYERSSRENHISTLNIQYTGDIRDQVNGVLLSVSPGDIDALAEREYGYDIIPVEYEGSNRKGSAYMFIARQSQQIGHRVRNDILPNESALTICLTGASTYGKEFLEAWINSCSLADGTALTDHPYYKNIIDEFLDSTESH